MKVICFEDNARGGLLTHLGFDSTTIAAAAEAYVRSKTGHVLPPPQHTIAAPPRSNSEKATSAGELFDAPQTSFSPLSSTGTGSGYVDVSLSKINIGSSSTSASSSALSALSPSTAGATAEMVAAALAGEGTSV